MEISLGCLIWTFITHQLLWTIACLSEIELLVHDSRILEASWYCCIISWCFSIILNKTRWINMALWMIKISIWIWISWLIRLFIFLILFHIHVSRCTINYWWLWDSAIFIWINSLHCIYSFFRLGREFVNLIHILNMSYILCKIRNISSLELSLTMVWIVEVWLNVLLGMRLPIESLLLVDALIGVMLTQIVDHVCLSLHQKACGFVQRWILSCLRIGHLSGIELLTDLGLSDLITTSIRVLVTNTLCSHLLIVLLVAYMCDMWVTMLHTLYNLGLLNCWWMNTWVVVLNLFWEEWFWMGFVLLNNTIRGRTIWLV